MRRNETVPWNNVGKQSDSNEKRTLGHVEPTMGGVVTQGQVHRPVVLLIVDKEPEIGLQPLIGSLRLPVRPGVISGGDILFDT